MVAISAIDVWRANIAVMFRLKPASADDCIQHSAELVRKTTMMQRVGPVQCKSGVAIKPAERLRSYVLRTVDYFG